MKLYIRFSFSVLTLMLILNCSRISEKVEQKVNEKIDQKIDESMKKLDSGFSKEKLDSLNKLMDSISTKQDKKTKK